MGIIISDELKGMLEEVAAACSNSFLLLVWRS
jgi:hypothetical protein